MRPWLPLAGLAALLLLWWWLQEEKAPVLGPLERDPATVIEAAPPPEVVAGPVEREEVPEPVFVEREVPSLAGAEGYGLELRFFDEASGLPVSGVVHLWRLNVAEDDFMTAGDELAAEGEAVDGVWRIDALPAGEYRAYPLFGRHEGRTDAAFLHGERWSQVRQEVPMPRTFARTVEFRRVDGRRYEAGRDGPLAERWAGVRRRTVVEPTPPWASPRRSKGLVEFSLVGGGGGYGSRSNVSWIAWEPIDGLLPLGEMAEDDRSNRILVSRNLQLDGESGLRLEVPASAAEDYVAVLATPTEVQERLFFPDGHVRLDLKPYMTVVATAAPVGSEGADAAWPQATLDISVDAPGWKRIDRTWSPAEGGWLGLELRLEKAAAE
ncbi:MAG: hypothetical protein ACYTF3_04510 [Planctomycetota bacterium]|jgi:hypothetical protein